MKRTIIGFFLCMAAAGGVAQQANVSNVITLLAEPELTLVGGSVSLDDANHNGYIDAGEQCTLRFQVKNTGTIDAENCEITLMGKGVMEGSEDFACSSTGSSIKAGETVDFDCEFVADSHIQDGGIPFFLDVTASNTVRSIHKNLSFVSRTGEDTRMQQLAKQAEEWRNQLIRDLETLNESMSADDHVSDDIEMTVKPEVVIETSPYGEKEANLQVEFAYQTKADEELVFTAAKNTDDYPVGAYHPAQSKACRLILQFIQDKIEKDFDEYFTKGTIVTIDITGTTDGTPIHNVIPYKGEYGDLENEDVNLNGRVDYITVTKATGITRNAQLAYLRTQGVKDFLDKNVLNLHKTDNRYRFFAVEHKERGNQYRKISVRFTVHGAFNNTLGLAAPAHDIPQKQSDVDTGIPATGINNINTFALIIANENYKNTQFDPVPFAQNDGRIFREYCIQTLGIPAEQVFLEEDATLTTIKNNIDRLTKSVKYVHDANVIVYYAGHGDLLDGYPYLIPADAPQKAEYLIALSDLYQQLSELPCQSVICLLDACNSGATGTRGVKVHERPKEPIHGNLVVLSAAEASQKASPYKEQQHGLFTYFMLKTLKETKGDITLNDLFEQVKNQVGKKAQILGLNDQTVNIQTSEELGDEWKEWKLK